MLSRFVHLSFLCLPMVAYTHIAQAITLHSSYGTDKKPIPGCYQTHHVLPHPHDGSTDYITGIKNKLTCCQNVCARQNKKLVPPPHTKIVQKGLYADASFIEDHCRCASTP